MGKVWNEWESMFKDYEEADIRFQDILDEVWECLDKDSYTSEYDPAVCFWIEDPNREGEEVQIYIEDVILPFLIQAEKERHSSSWIASKIEEFVDKGEVDVEEGSRYKT